MDPKKYASLKQILKQYFTDIEYTEITEIDSKLVNETYKVKIRKSLYILQKLSIFFNETIIEDMIQVTDYLELNKYQVPHLLETLTGDRYVKIDNNFYRIYKYIYAETPNKFELSNNDLKTLGCYLANIHKSLNNLQYTPKHKVDNFHNTDHYIKKIKTYITKFSKEDKEIIEAMISVYEKTNKDFISKKEPTQIIHGDPRIENLLHDKKTNEYSIIDFDTLMINNKYIDIAILCRSLFITNNSDEINYSRKMHEKFITGYYLTMVKNTQKIDRISKEQFTKHCIDITMLLSLEFSLRFYIDMIEDKNFSYDTENFASRKEHNLVRAENSYELFRIIHKDNF